MGVAVAAIGCDRSDWLTIGVSRKARTDSLHERAGRNPQSLSCRFVAGINHAINLNGPSLVHGVRTLCRRRVAHRLGVSFRPNANKV